MPLRILLLGDNAVDNRLRPESKKHIIRCAYKVLLRNGAANFSIRQVAQECGSSVSGLYRHFASRDELLVYASLMSMEAYYKELGSMVNRYSNSIDSYFEIERLFAKYSFSEPEMFYNIYFGIPDGDLDKIMLDSFALFENSPEEFFLFQFGKRFIGGGISGRNMAMLMKCHEEGFFSISEEELMVFNTGIINLYRGFLDKAISMKRRGENISGLAGEYLFTHRMLHKSILSSKADISVI